MKATLPEIEKYLGLLTATPQRIQEAVKGWNEAQLQSKAGNQSWSVNEILAHLRSCADLWTYSIYAMLAENEPAFSDINERKWAKVTGYADLSFAQSFQAYALQRKNLLRVLQALPFES